MTGLTESDMETPPRTWRGQQDLVAQRKSSHRFGVIRFFGGSRIN